MPLVSNLRERLGRALKLRFATPAARFRLAVGAGFVIAAVGFTSIVINDQDGIADDWFGAGGVFGLQQPAAPEAQGQPAQGSSHGWFAPRRHREARRHAKAEPARFLRSVERAHTTHADGPMQLGRESVCVRLCDGFAFPVGSYHGEQDRASHEATCRSECPGAATALYVVPSGADSMDGAVKVGTDKTYSDLPYAFHYTTVMSEACSCHPPEGNRIKSLLRDFTLRRGDAVMTGTGVKVFHGGDRFPYKRKDFVKLDWTRDVSSGARATFRDIERASLISAPNVVAQTVRSKPATKTATKTGMKTGTTKGLEHQASLAGLTPPPPLPPEPAHP